MYEILIPVDDDDDRARQQVEAVLEMPLDHDEIHVVLLHVFTENDEGASVGQLEAIRAAEDRLDEAGVEAELAESSGSPAEEIVALADERDSDMLVLAGRRRSPTGKAVFGSTTQRVIIDTDRTVVVRSVEE
ncbi:MAG: universal stress protein [Halarchaeum sp.]